MTSTSTSSGSIPCFAAKAAPMPTPSPTAMQVGITREEPNTTGSTLMQRPLNISRLMSLAIVAHK
ncbi:hypothetical protein [Paenibacillus sp. EZ-K15]|uniref:hypothetical protein n=1 Tax=Paenibacillus sp. EZ-K15 TaxID=2044275 RepID=UPI001F242464|nr:hypothetical protein [Paenibacillus sp. EZ-K15]